MVVTIPSRSDLQAIVDQTTQQQKDQLAEVVVDFLEDAAGQLLAGQVVEQKVSTGYTDALIDWVVSALVGSGHYSAEHIKEGQRRYLRVILL